MVEDHSAAAGFTLTRRQSLQLHYARTLDLWAQALQARETEAIELQSQEVYERYMKYLTGCAKSIPRRLHRRQPVHSAEVTDALQGAQRRGEVVLGEHGHPADLLAEFLRRGAPVVGEGDVGALAVGSEIVAPEPAAGDVLAGFVEPSRHPPDGTVLFEHIDQVVRDVVTTGPFEEHVHREHLSAGGDRCGVHRVADPVGGLGVAVAGRVGQDGEDLLPGWRRCCG